MKRKSAAMQGGLDIGNYTVGGGEIMMSEDQLLEQCVKTLELQNTNVGDIQINKDQSNDALFHFLGKLQHYQRQ